MYIKSIIRFFFRNSQCFDKDRSHLIICEAGINTLKKSV